jgi:hypothetical protein
MFFSLRYAQDWFHSSFSLAYSDQGCSFGSGLFIRFRAVHSAQGCSFGSGLFIRLRAGLLKKFENGVNQKRTKG